MHLMADIHRFNETKSRKHQRIFKAKSKQRGELSIWLATFTFPVHQPQQFYKHLAKDTKSLRYFVPRVPITGNFLNGYPMFSVKKLFRMSN